MSRFIVFEGIDGSGKTTQIEKLRAKMQEINIDCEITREPTDGDIGRLLRSYLKGERKTDNRAIAALFASDRLDHITASGGILDILHSGKSLVCDRYYLSSYAYHAVDCDLDWVMETNRLAAELANPDLHIFLDVPAETAMERVTCRGERELFEQLDRQKKIRENFFDIFEILKDRENILVVDGTASPDEIADRIWDEVKKLF